ncbi:MAG: biopolymer transporter ExbD [Pseudomonadota bacterium]
MNLRQGTRRSPGPGIDITPLVDVVFILLIFLLISTTFKTRESAFRILLPKASETRAVVTAKRPTIYVTREGDMFLYVPAADGGDAVEGRPVGTLDELELRLERLKESNPGVGISVKADSATEYQRIMDVVNKCYLTGIEHVFFPFRPAQE